MRSFLALAVAAIVAMLLQTAVFPAVPWLPVVPNLILVLVVYLGARHQGMGGVCGAFLLGYFLDTFSGTILGLHAFALTAVYAVVYVIARTLWMQGGLPVVGVVFIGACIGEVVTLGLGMVVAGGPALWHHVVRYGLLEAGVTALLAPVVFGGVARERRLLGLS